MPFTPITLTGSFTRPDGTPARGRLTALLSQEMRNGTQIIEATPVYGILNPAGQLKDATGELPLVLEANDDPGTIPVAPSASYEFTLMLDVSAPQPFNAVISHLAAGATVDLSALV